MNNFYLSGLLTANPELKSTGTGTAMCTFSFCQNKVVKRDNGYEEVPMFFNFFALFGKQAEYFAAHAVKGTQIFITGHFDTYTKADETGKQRSHIGYVIDRVELGARAVFNQNGNNNQQAQANPNQNVNNNVTPMPNNQGFSQPMNNGFMPNNQGFNPIMNNGFSQNNGNFQNEAFPTAGDGGYIDMGAINNDDLPFN